MTWPPKVNIDTKYEDNIDTKKKTTKLTQNMKTTLKIIDLTNEDDLNFDNDNDIQMTMRMTMTS